MDKLQVALVCLIIIAISLFSYIFIRIKQKSPLNSQLPELAQSQPKSNEKILPSFPDNTEEGVIYFYNYDNSGETRSYLKGSILDINNEYITLKDKKEPIYYNKSTVFKYDKISFNQGKIIKDSNDVSVKDLHPGDTVHIIGLKQYKDSYQAGQILKTTINQ